MRRQRHDLWSTDSKEWLGVDDECADPSFRQCRKGIVKLALTAGAPRSRQRSKRRCETALRLCSAAGDHRQPLLLGATRRILALRGCKAGLDRVPERQCHGIGL
jgi:hypothetical protein